MFALFKEIEIKIVWRFNFNNLKLCSKKSCFPIDWYKFLSYSKAFNFCISNECCDSCEVNLEAIFVKEINEIIFIVAKGLTICKIFCFNYLKINL